jgi:hypothetical protein
MGWTRNRPVLARLPAIPQKPSRPTRRPPFPISRAHLSGAPLSPNIDHVHRPLLKSAAACSTIPGWSVPTSPPRRTPDWPLCLAYRARTPFGTVGPVLGARSSRVPLPCPGLLLPPQHPASSARTCSTRTKSALTGLASQAARSSPPVAARPPERSRAHWPPRRRPTAPRTHRPDRTTVPTKPRAAHLLKAFPGQHFVPSPTLFRRR